MSPAGPRDPALPHTTETSSGKGVRRDADLLPAALAAGVAEIDVMPHGEQRAWALRGLATLLLDLPASFRAATFAQCPELATAEPIPDTYLHPDEAQRVASLTPSELQAIDRALVGGTSTAWRGAWRPVGAAMVALEGCLPPQPLGIYAQRIGVLVNDGVLEVQGDVRFIRHCKLRRPSGEGTVEPSP